MPWRSAMGGSQAGRADWLLRPGVEVFAEKNGERGRVNHPNAVYRSHNRYGRTKARR